MAPEMANEQDCDRRLRVLWGSPVAIAAAPQAKSLGDLAVNIGIVCRSVGRGILLTIAVIIEVN